MSRQNETKALEAEKRRNALAEAGQKFFAELKDLCVKEQVSIVPYISRTGPPSIEIVSLRPPEPPSLLHRLHLKKYHNTELDRIKILDAVIKTVLEKHNLVWYATITPLGAQINVDFKPDYNPSVLWTPPETDKIIGAEK